MEEKTNRPGAGDAEFLLGQLGKGIQLIVQAVLFIVCGAVVVVYEGFGKFFQAVYEKGTQYGKDLVAPAAPKPPAQKVKVRVLPIDDYSRLTVDQIIDRLQGLSPEELTLIKSFEIGQQNRSAVLEAIDRRVSEVH
jgi:hypothetical protein